MIHIGGVYTPFCREEGILCRSIVIEMGGVSQYFSKESGSVVDLILMRLALKSHESHSDQGRNRCSHAI